ncbi:MAG: hypothetical protein NC084_09580 [Bacteroides sp.]|nr:hypothetical protein [Eubacterium sp.]MCM1419086.1 hypothetical protein [Roseburia sp.]MCM1462948.1 hypothetical protein [Bacteroides sp.]
MLIMDSEGKCLADIQCLQIHKNIGAKAGQKWSIAGYTLHLAESTLGASIVLGTYADEDDARAELDRVAAFFEENPGRVYRFMK